MIDAFAVPAGGTVLEVGCGAGSLARRLARRVGPTGRVVAVDVNAYFLREAAALAGREEMGERIAFQPGDPEALPFPDASFDAVLTSTVLEEVDADRALAELARVVRPGGRTAVVVRADDIPFWDSLPLRLELRAKVATRPKGGASARGCSDASLYRRFLGLADVRMGPQLAIDRVEDGLRDARGVFEAQVLAALAAAEVSEGQAALAQAEAEGSYLWGQGYHCAVGTRP